MGFQLNLNTAMENFKNEFIRDNMDSVLIIYHKEDNDGACSAGIIKAFLEKYSEVYSEVSHIHMMGVTYPDLSNIWSANGRPDMKEWQELYDTVFMVDISFNDPMAMESMYNHWGDSFIWCDHHKPAIDISKEYDYGGTSGIRRTDQSALMNVWDFMVEMYNPFTIDRNGFHKKLKVSPEMIMLSDYDSWAWSRKDAYKDPKVKENMFNINTGMMDISDLNPEWFAEWIWYWLGGKYTKYSKFVTDAQVQGERIRALDSKRIRKAIEEHGDMNWVLAGSKKCCMVFTTEHMNSQAFDNISDSEIRNRATLKYNASNDCWTMSLYNLNNDDEFDCGVYLKEHYGGGGHKGAAGCTLSNEQVSKLMLTKCI